VRGAISNDRPYRNLIDNRGRMESERPESILAADARIDYTSLLPAAEKLLRVTPWDGLCHELRRNHRRTETLAVATTARSKSSSDFRNRLFSSLMDSPSSSSPDLI
jgi:hypothetical protein